MLMMEFMKVSCLWEMKDEMEWEMKDEMEWEPIRLWRAVVGHLVGRPWMVRRILRWVRSYIDVQLGVGERPLSIVLR